MVMLRKKRRRFPYVFPNTLRKCSAALVIVWTMIIFLRATEILEFSSSSTARHFDQRLSLLSDHNKNLFLQTLKGSNMIKPAMNNPPRVAVISPPGAIGVAFFLCVQEALDKFHFDEKSSEKDKIELIYTTNAPPYGYGKNHGYDKIVRLVDTSLEIGVIDAFIFFKGQHGLITLDEMNVHSIMKQQVRWHCRLNHVSAHTPLMTVTLQQMIEHPMKIAHDVAAFVANHMQLEQAVLSNVSGNSFDRIVEEEVFKGASTSKSTEGILLNSINSFNTAVKDVMQQKEQLISPDISLDDLNENLLIEFTRTNNLKNWPCESLWSVDGAGKLDMSDTLPSLFANALAPDCSSPKVECFVKRDQCEHVGKTPC